MCVGQKKGAVERWKNSEQVSTKHPASDTQWRTAESDYNLKTAWLWSLWVSWPGSVPFTFESGKLCSTIAHLCHVHTSTNNRPHPSAWHACLHTVLRHKTPGIQSSKQELCQWFPTCVLWPFEGSYSLSCISDTYILIHISSRIIVMKQHGYCQPPQHEELY